VTRTGSRPRGDRRREFGSLWGHQGVDTRSGPDQACAPQQKRPNSEAGHSFHLEASYSFRSEAAHLTPSPRVLGMMFLFPDQAKGTLFGRRQVSGLLALLCSTGTAIPSSRPPIRRAARRVAVSAANGCAQRPRGPQARCWTVGRAWGGCRIRARPVGVAFRRAPLSAKAHSGVGVEHVEMYRDGNLGEAGE